MRARKPHFPLERIRHVAAAANGLFIQRGRALDFFPTLSEAFATARRVIVQLADKDFSATARLAYDIADVYGVRLNGRGWYLKITLDEGVPEVVVISFHPLERPLRTNGGTVKP